MPNIRVDDDVYRYLKRRAEAFVDTPNSVLRRILGLDGTDDGTDGVAPTKPKLVSTRARTKSRSSRKTSNRGVRATPGTLLPETEYVPVLLAALHERGGSGQAAEIAEVVGRVLNGRLTHADKEPLASGGIRWRNRLQFVRLRLVEEGLLAKDSPRGVWQLTQEGQTRADHAVGPSA